jgi:hypothetical protein
MENIDVRTVIPIHKKYMDSPYYEKDEIKRTYEVTRFEPKEIISKSKLLVEIPKLSTNECMIPNTLNLLVRLKNTGTKSWFLNNIGRLLCKELKIYFSGSE